MAPVENLSSASLLPTGVVVSHLLLTGYLSLLVVRTIYRSFLALPPSSSTRHREPLRRGHVHIFSALAITSCLTAVYFTSKFASLSYRVWAAERGVELPDGFFGDKGALRYGEHPGRLHVVRWLNDTSFYRDGLEIVAEKARHFWWGQQASLSLVSFGNFLAMEGRRRKIPHLWAFVVLAQTVSLSYAQNLFFMAFLLTPIPLPENVKDLTRTSVPGGTSSRLSNLKSKFILTKPDGWQPKPAILITTLVLSYTALFLVPFAANTPSFLSIITITRLLPFVPGILPYVVPESFGTVTSHPHAFYQSFTTISRIIAIFSALLHLKSTGLALFYNTPDRHYYRHSLLHPFKEEHRSALDRSSIAFSRVLSAIGEHPAVGSVGWDVMISGLSLGLWVAIRGLDPKIMLSSVVPFMERAKEIVEEAEEDIKPELKAIEHIEPTTIRRGRGRPRKVHTTEAEVNDTVHRRRTRTSREQDEDDENDAYHPTENDHVENGDEDGEEDWEVGALAWGLIAAAGLGAGSAAVYGAEIMAR